MSVWRSPKINDLQQILDLGPSGIAAPLAARPEPSPVFASAGQLCQTPPTCPPVCTQ